MEWKDVVIEINVGLLLMCFNVNICLIVRLKVIMVWILEFFLVDNII